MALGRLATKIKRKMSPFPSQLVDNVGLTVGTKSGNTINVAAVAKDAAYHAQSVATALRAYLAADAAGQTILLPYNMPSGGYAIGTNGLIRHEAQHREALYSIGTLLIDASAAKFKTTTTANYRAGGAQYALAATTAIVLTGTHTINANKFGIFLVQVDAAGAVTTKDPGNAMNYATAPLALAALPAPDAGKVALGYIAVAAGGGGFTAGTTALTGIATFVDAPASGGYSPSFTVITTAAGLFDITFTETRSPSTFYLAVVLPDGSLQVSPAITF